MSLVTDHSRLWGVPSCRSGAGPRPINWPINGNAEETKKVVQDPDLWNTDGSDQPKNGAYRGPIGQKNLGEFRFFLIVYCILGFLGVYIFPKWLKKVPGHIPILFG